MPKEGSTLVVWLGERVIQLFRIPFPLDEYKVADGCYLNFCEGDNPEGCDHAEHLSYLLGVEPHHGEIPTLAALLKERAADRMEPLAKPKSEELYNPRYAPAPFAEYEIGGGPVVVDSVIRCGWVV